MKFRFGMIAVFAVIALGYGSSIAAMAAPGGGMLALAEHTPSGAEADPAAVPPAGTVAKQEGARTGPGPSATDVSRHGDDEVPAVAIVIPTVFFATLVIVVVAGLYAAYRRDRSRHETLRAIIERGGDLPPELLMPPSRPRSDLRRGVLLLAGGLGLMIVLGALSHEKGVWTAGLVPVLLGLGYLLVWKIEPPRPLRGDYDKTHDYRS
jgi:hypothetical protein